MSDLVALISYLVLIVIWIVGAARFGWVVGGILHRAWAATKAELQNTGGTS